MMDDIKKQDYERAFRKLKRTYLKRLHNTARIIDNILELGRLTPYTHNDILRAQSLMHGLAGSGTTFGYPEISATGASADEFIEAMVRATDTPLAMDETQYQQFTGHLRAAQDMCREIYNRARVEMPELANTNDPKPDTDHPHILIIEDDKEVCMAMAQALQHAGMMVQMSASGEDAFYYLGQRLPDVTLIDLNLADMNGLELLQQIKQNSEFMDAAVIIMATRHNEGEELFAQRAGAAAYIRKPIDIEQLLDTVQDVLHGDHANALVM